MNNNKKLIASSAFLLSLTSAAQAQTGIPDVPCGRQDTDVNVVLRGALNLDSIAGAYQESFRDQTIFDDDGGWGQQLESQDLFLDVRTPYNKFIMASTLVTMGIGGAPVPISQFEHPTFGTIWGYDTEALYPTRNHNLPIDYWELSESFGGAACVSVNPFDGSPLCTDGEPDGSSIWAKAYFANPSYGPRELNRRVEEIGENGPAGRYSDSVPLNPASPDHLGHALIEYGCEAFDNTRGVIALAELMVHENFHAIGADHERCEGDDEDDFEACAKAWDYDLPTYPSAYNGLATFASADSYQIGYRFSCDLIEEPQDWVPLLILVVANERAHERAAISRYLNVRDELGNVLGSAPLACGLPQPALDGFRCTVIECSSSADCIAGESCFDGCCADSSSCPLPGGNNLCDSDTDCGENEKCDQGCCFPVVK